ncbi:MAG: hypothetical protein H7Y15_00885 [Pseudonocardia sp.]|nr:hypothetical protein [Pseudonocardia sp.]
MGRDPELSVHPRGLYESDQVGAGTRIWAFAHVMPGAVVGRDCHVGDHAFVETGARVGDRKTVQDQDVEEQRAAPDQLLVEGDHLVEGQVAAAAHLPERRISGSSQLRV